MKQQFGLLLMRLNRLMTSPKLKGIRRRHSLCEQCCQSMCQGAQLNSPLRFHTQWMRSMAQRDGSDVKTIFQCWIPLNFFAKSMKNEIYSRKKSSFFQTRKNFSISNDLLFIENVPESALLWNTNRMTDIGMWEHILTYTFDVSIGYRVYCVHRIVPQLLFSIYLFLN